MALDVQGDRAVVRVRGIEQQVALARLDVRRHPQAQAGHRRDPAVPDRLRFRFVVAPAAGQAQRGGADSGISSRMSAWSRGLAPLAWTRFSSWHSARVDPQ